MSSPTKVHDAPDRGRRRRSLAHNVGSAEPAPALVTRVGQFGSRSSCSRPPEGRHRPRRRAAHRRPRQREGRHQSDTGVWDYTESHKLLLALRDLAAVQQGAKPAK
jgi:hypothetical protein